MHSHPRMAPDPVVATRAPVTRLVTLGDVTEPGLVQLTDEEASALREVMERLRRQLKGSESFVRLVVEPPVTGSAIQTAYAGDCRDEFDLAYGALHPAEDHLRTILWVVERGVLPGFSLYTLMRSATEALARAWYLLSPPTVVERRARALNVREDNLLEQAKVGKPKPRKGRPPRRSADQLRFEANQQNHLRKKLKWLEDRASQLGVDVTRERDGKLVFGSARLPQRWELIADAMDEGELAYQVMSGFVHTMQWATLQTDRAVPTDDPAVSQAPTDLDVDKFLGILGRVLDVHDRVVARWMTLAGQPAEVWQLAKQGQ
jgi:hypothetical protein